jgi:hypothetical protein
MNQSASSYVVSIEAEHFRQRTRYHWMVCGAQNPDELVSWGNAPTLEQAEMAAQNEVLDLSSGRTQGGRVVCTVTEFTRRR